MHSHLVEFLSAVFVCFNVRSTLSIIVRRCLKSLKVKSEVKSFSRSQGSGNGIHIQFNKLKELRKKKFGLLKNKICTNLFYVDVLKWTPVTLDLFPCLARDRKSSPQRRIVANIFGKEVDLRSREVCSTNSQSINSKSINIQLSSHLGHQATLDRKGLKCQQKFA